MRAATTVVPIVVAALLAAPTRPPVAAAFGAEIPPSAVVALSASRLAAFRAAEGARREISWYRPTAAADALYTLSAVGRAPERGLTAALAQRLRLPAAAGEPLAEAVLALSELETAEEALSWGQPAPEARAAAEAAVLAGLRAAAGAAPAMELVAALYEDPGDRAGADDRRLLAVVESLDRPVETALRLAGELSGPRRAALLGFALDHGGDRAAVLLLAGDELIDPALGSVLAETAFRELDARIPAGEGATSDLAELRLLAADRWLGALLAGGLLAEACQAWEQLPGEIREALLAGRTGPLSGELAGAEIEAELGDRRPQLAALFALGGETAAAREILADLPAAASDADPPAAGAEGDEAADPGPALAAATVRRLLDGSTESAFDLLVDLEAVSDRWRSEGTLGRAVVRLAQRAGYPEIAAYWRRLLVDRLRHAGDIGGRGISGVPSLPAALEAAVATRMDAFSRLAAELAAAADAAPAHAADGARSILVGRSLARPRLAPFVERSLPAAIQPIELEWQAEQDERQRRLAGVPVPPGFPALRAERFGAEVVALGTAQDYDPVGEMSAGGYWLVRSHDGGASWDEPLYTGLRLLAPYEARAVSNLPLLDERGQPQIEVSIRELDTAEVIFPPLARPLRREADGLYLTTSWEDLERDGDDDGLRDLAEERLLTDPERADSDGDGLSDAVDPLPQVAWVAPRDDRAAALTALLALIAGQQDLAILPDLRAPLSCCGDGPSLADQRTLFLVVPAGTVDLAGVGSAYRVVVLDRDEVSAYDEKFGGSLPVALELLAVDHAGDRALAIWNAGWQGGSVVLRRRGRSWEVESETSWIT